MILDNKYLSNANIINISGKINLKKYFPIKTRFNYNTEIGGKISFQNYKNYQGITSASVYLKAYNNNEWMTVNEEENYEPGSLFKVPILIAYLKMNEEHPGVLDKELSFNNLQYVNKNK